MGSSKAAQDMEENGAAEPTAPQQPAFEVHWEDGAHTENPRSWPVWYKAFVLVTVSWTTLVVVIASTSYTSGLQQMQLELGAASEAVVALGLTTYLFGWAVGSLVLAPLSELYGRRYVYLASITCFLVLMTPCGLLNSLPGIIVMRFFAAVAGAGAIALSPGTISDIANDEQRTLAYSIWSIGPFTAPAFGPILGGFAVQQLGWRWLVWIVMAGAALAFVLLLFVRESYAPVLLRHKAVRLRAATGDPRWWCRYESDQNLVAKLKVNLSRPFVLGLLEPMLLLWNTYIGLIYGVLYLSFTIYPPVFEGLRGWSTSMGGLAFLGIGIGTLLCIIAAPLIRCMIRRLQGTQKPPRPEATISVVCIAAVLLPVGEFWFAWTSAPPVHWVWPILAGVPFGFGATANFIYALNYLSLSYSIYAASVMASNTVWRCAFGGTLLLAGPAMIERLGPHWAGTMLALLLTVMAPIPFVFYVYGANIRGKSARIAAARAEEERLHNQ